MAVSAIQPVLYLPTYAGYCIEENMFNAQREKSAKGIALTQNTTSTASTP